MTREIETWLSDSRVGQWLNHLARAGGFPHADATPSGLKLEPKGPRAEVGFPTVGLGCSSIQGTLFGFYGI